MASFPQELKHPQIRSNWYRLASRARCGRETADDILAASLNDTLANHIKPFDQAVGQPALWNEQRERVRLEDEDTLSAQHALDILEHQE